MNPITKHRIDFLSISLAYIINSTVFPVCMIIIGEAGGYMIWMICKMHTKPDLLGPLLLTWFNLNPSMDK